MRGDPRASVSDGPKMVYFLLSSFIGPAEKKTKVKGNGLRGPIFPTDYLGN